MIEHPGVNKQQHDACQADAGMPVLAVTLGSPTMAQALWWLTRVASQGTCPDTAADAGVRLQRSQECRLPGQEPRKGSTTLATGEPRLPGASTGPLAAASPNSTPGALHVASTSGSQAVHGLDLAT